MSNWATEYEEGFQLLFFFFFSSQKEKVDLFNEHQLIPTSTSGDLLKTGNVGLLKA